MDQDKQKKIKMSEEKIKSASIAIDKLEKEIEELEKYYENRVETNVDIFIGYVEKVLLLNNKIEEWEDYIYSHTNIICKLQGKVIQKDPLLIARQKIRLQKYIAEFENKLQNYKQARSATDLNKSQLVEKIEKLKEKLAKLG